MTNPIVSIEKIITINASGGVLGIDGQNKYTLIKKDKREEKVTNGDLADDIHPLGLVKMKQIIDKEKSG
ncbi:hypothetical protein Hanom_Chr13g01201041 [Helianthus anomalus]